MNRIRSVLLILIVGFAATTQLATGQSPSQKSAASQTSAAAATPKPSAADIAAAKASHKVWVNLDSGIYHKGGRWYGKTKNGKFMTLDDAKKAGYKPAKPD